MTTSLIVQKSKHFSPVFLKLLELLVQILIQTTNIFPEHLDTKCSQSKWNLTFQEKMILL